MKKVLGTAGVLIAVIGFTSILSPHYLEPTNLEFILQRKILLEEEEVKPKLK